MLRFVYLIAAVLAVLAAGVHFVVVGSEIYDPLMQTKMDLKQQAVLGVVWHATGATMLICAAALLWAAYAGNPRAKPVGLLTGLLLTALGALYLSASWFWLNDPVALPYWTLILPAGLLAFSAAV